MYSKRQRLGELLISHRLITQEQLVQALTLQRERAEPLGSILIQQGFITEERLLQVCAIQKGVDPWFLQDRPPSREALDKVPAHLCNAFQLVPVEIRNGRLVLGMRDPADMDAIDMVRNITKMRVEPVLVSGDRLRETLQKAGGAGETNTALMTQLVSQAIGELQSESRDSNAQEVSEAEMRPVVTVVNQVLTEAIQMHASDIHIEPRKDHVEIRYRVDGQLQKVHQIPSKLQAALIARVKIMAQLDIVEYRVPQDGRMSFTVDGRIIDLRVSVLPNYYGQRIVMRILDKNATLRQLSELGFSAHNLSLFNDLIHKPYGLILVTGPTGSGKTTSLYAALNQLKKVTNNIMTCEDPVEYDIAGINQSAVNEKVGLTFASQLRAILRQDPDIVLVGEIRDKETAETAIRAALTGHLVLSTLHCNDAASAIPRLTDMGIEPFLLSTALIGVTAQRLIRVLCPHCRESYTPSAEERGLLDMEETDTRVLWRPKGCAKCRETGFQGRMGIHEVFPAPREVQRAIAARESLETIRNLAAEYGYQTMQQDASARILAGQLSLEEVQRLVFFETVTKAHTQPLALKIAS